MFLPGFLLINLIMCTLIMKKIFQILAEITIFQLIIVLNLYSQTEVLKWKDGKSTCVSITYDDGSINQFKIAMPIMDRLGLPGLSTLTQAISQDQNIIRLLQAVLSWKSLRKVKLFRQPG